MKIKDGWHIVKGYEVYVKDGRVIRGVKEDINGGEVPAYPYKSVEGGWMIGKPPVSTFREGIRRGNWMLF